MPQFTRRQFIGAATAGSAALMTGCSMFRAAAPPKKPLIGVQLYSVRYVFANDVPGTLAGIKNIGYDAVEFAGYATYANNAAGLRKILDDNGLIACGTHMPGGLQGVTPENFDKTVEFNQILGNQKLIVASLANTATADDWARNADTFSAIAEKLKPHHMRIGYHNHVAEFKPIAGPGSPMPEDIFFGKASPDVFVELDIGHCAHAGADPVAALKKYAGRVLSVHVKDWVPATGGDIIGEGIVKWPEVLDACDHHGGAVQWYIVEEESGKFPILTGIEKDFQNLQQLFATHKFPPA
ncbi:MAG: sugar phosphate isomerase/epimerase [Verrucomicrobiota bacterium]|jgi:sugar phosphate isomerase/epimerase